MMSQAYDLKVEIDYYCSEEKSYSSGDLMYFRFSVSAISCVNFNHFFDHFFEDETWPGFNVKESRHPRAKTL